MQDHVDFLGYQVDSKGIHTLPDKLNVIVKAPSPATEIFPWTTKLLWEVYTKPSIVDSPSKSPITQGYQVELELRL